MVRSLGRAVCVVERSTGTSNKNTALIEQSGVGPPLACMTTWGGRLWDLMASYLGHPSESPRASGICGACTHGVTHARTVGVSRSVVVFY